MSSDSGSDEYPRAPAQKARDENILGVFEASDDPVVTTAEVAAELPIGKRATLNRLEDLADRGEIDSKDVGVGRVWWRVEPEALEDDESEPEEPLPETAPAPPEGDPTGPAPASGATDDGATQSPELEDDPRWAFIGSLGKHSIYAGVFLIGLLLTESITTQALLPVSVSRLFLTAFVFFLIGFPSVAAYRTKTYLETVDLSISQFVSSFR